MLMTFCLCSTCACYTSRTRAWMRNSPPTATASSVQPLCWLSGCSRLDKAYLPACHCQSHTSHPWASAASSIFARALRSLLSFCYLFKCLLLLFHVGPSLSACRHVATSMHVCALPASLLCPPCGLLGPNVPRCLLLRRVTVSCNTLGSTQGIIRISSSARDAESSLNSTAEDWDVRTFKLVTGLRVRLGL